MQRSTCLTLALLFVASAAFAQQRGGGAAQPVGLAAAAQQSYNRVKGLVTGSANEMPESGFSHRPADGIRTFAQLFGHISNSHYNVCSTARGVANPNMGTNLEETVSTKAEVIKMLEASYAFCDPAFMSLTDQNASEMVTGGRGGPRARLGVLSQLLEHDNEMYGISTVYLRTNGEVPPASQGRGRGAGGRGQAPAGGRGQ